MSTQVIEYVSPQLFISNPISQAFFLIDNRVLAVCIFAIGLLMIFSQYFFEKTISVNISTNNARFIKVLDLVSVLFLALGAFSYSYGLTDEVFVNLVHPLNFLHHGIFSFDPNKKVDGTVEPLFYFIHILGRTQEGIIRFNFIFSFLLFLASAFIVEQLFINSPRHKLIRNLYAVFPPIVFAVSTGFGGVFFNFLFLLGLLAIIRRSKKLLYFSLFMIAIARPEGGGFAGVLVLVWALYERKFLVPFLITLCGTTCFFSFYYLYYGHWVPTPAFFKELPIECLRHLDLFSLWYRGFDIFSTRSYDATPYVRSFFSQNHIMMVYELIWTFFVYVTLIIIVAAFFALIKGFFNKESFKKSHLHLFGLILFLMLPFFALYTEPPGALAGMSRYYLIHISMVFCIIVEMIVFLLASKKTIKVKVAYIMMALFAFYTSYLYFSAKIQLVYNRNFDANVGLFFKNLPENFKLSSSEMDTIGFFSGKSIIDLWGYTNTAISKSNFYDSSESRKINPYFFESVSPAIAYNTANTSKIDWSIQPDSGFGGARSRDYALDNVFGSSSPETRGDESKGFKYPTDPRWLLDNMAMPIYYGDPKETFSKYNIIFIHDENNMFAFLLRKDLVSEFQIWAENKGLKKTGTRTTDYIPNTSVTPLIMDKPNCSCWISSE